MIGRTHALSGLATYSIAVAAANEIGRGLSTEEIILCAPLVPAAALLLDIDHPDSTVSRSLGPVTRALSWFVNRVGGGHRKFTHSLIGGVGVFTALSALAVEYQDTWPGTIGCGLLLMILFVSLARLADINGWVDEAIAAIIAIAVLVSGIDLRMLPWAVSLGTLTHLAGDLPTVQGIPLLWPIWPHPIRVPEPSRFVAGGEIELNWIRPALWIVIIMVVVWQTGMAATAIDAISTAR